MTEARRLARAGQHAEAATVYQRLISTEERASGGDSEDLVSLLHELAVQRHALEQIDEAEALYQRSVDAAQLLGGTRSQLLVPGLRGMAALAAGRGDINAALAFNLRALRIQEAVGDERKERARTLAEIALLSQLQGYEPFAEHFYRAVLESGNDAGLQPTEVATIAGNLGAMCASSGRYAEAEPFYRQAVEVREGELGPDDPGLAPVLYDLANLYLRLDRYAEAAPRFEHALRIREKTAPNDLALSDIVSQLAATYSRLGRTNEAELHFGMAKSMLDALCTKRERTDACRSSLEIYRESRELAGTAPTREESPLPPSRPALEPQPVRSIARPEPAPASNPAPPTAAAPPPSPQRATRSGTFYRAQIAARAAREEAEQFLHETRDAYSRLVGSLPATIVRVDLGERGIWYRIQVGEFETSSDARALCKQLIDRGLEGCWAVKAEG